MTPLSILESTMGIDRNLTSTVLTSSNPHTRIKKEGARDLYDGTVNSMHNEYLPSLMPHPHIAYLPHKMEFKSVFSGQTCIPNTDNLNCHPKYDLKQFSIPDPSFMNSNSMRQEDSVLTYPRTPVFYKESDTKLSCLEDPGFRRYALNKNVIKTYDSASFTSDAKLNSSQDGISQNLSNFQKQNGHINPIAENQSKPFLSPGPWSYDQINHSEAEKSHTSQFRMFESGIKRKMSVNCGLENSVPYSENSQRHKINETEASAKTYFRKNKLNDKNSQIWNIPYDSKYTCSVCGKTIPGYFLFALHKLAHNTECESNNVNEISQSNSNFIACRNLTTDTSLNTTNFFEPNKIENSTLKDGFQHAGFEFPSYMNSLIPFPMNMRQHHKRGMTRAMSPAATMKMNWPSSTANMLALGMGPRLMYPSVLPAFLPPLRPVNTMNTEVPSFNGNYNYIPHFNKISLQQASLNDNVTNSWYKNNFCIKSGFTELYNTNNSAPTYRNTSENVKATEIKQVYEADKITNTKTEKEDSMLMDRNHVILHDSNFSGVETKTCTCLECLKKQPFMVDNIMLNFGSPVIVSEVNTSTDSVPSTPVTENLNTLVTESSSSDEIDVIS